MSNAPHIAEVAALVGDPARANILCALLGGRALTATELAYAAGVSPQTTSGHLGKLFAARLIVLMKQGRHRYYRLAGPQVAQMLESIMNVALSGPPRFQPKSRLDDGNAPRPHLLRSHRRRARRRPCRAHERPRISRARRRSRRGDACRHGVSGRSSASTFRRRAANAGCSAGRASIGPSGVRISAARSAPLWRSA